MNEGYRTAAERILARAGVTINGANPWDIRVHDDRFFRRAFVEGELGVGEMYMDGWWDSAWGPR